MTAPGFAQSLGMHRRKRRRDLKVAVIGAGFGGIAVSVKLKLAGFERLIIFERSDGPGGTWRHNHYPGCEVDIHSHAYSFSFYRQSWLRTHASQPELHRYAEDIVEYFDLRRHLRFGQQVTSVAWDDEEIGYRVTLTSGESARFDTVVSCVGLLDQPHYPSWVGLNRFRGPVFHTSRWEPDHDLQGKRVALIGTGSTGVQVAPAIADQVEHLYIFQREPGWILPKGERDFTPSERIRFHRHPSLQKLNRARLFIASHKRARGFDVKSAQQHRYREECIRYINEKVEDPAVQAAVTPNYPWGCKRPIYSSNFYETLNHRNVTLVPRAVTELTESSIVDDSGTERLVDVVILGTGFKPTRYLDTLEVTGPRGRDLHATWGGDPRAFLGITVKGFPSFFILYGPNTNGGFSIIAQLERQAEFVVRALKRMARTGTPIDTRSFMFDRYVRWIDGQIADHASAMESGCHNYYHSSSGRNVTQWPRAHASYFVLTKVLEPLAMIKWSPDVGSGVNHDPPFESAINTPGDQPTTQWAAPVPE